MQNHYPPLAMLGLMACLFAAALVVPSQEWLALYLYLGLLAALAVWLYRKGLHPVEPSFPAALFLMAVAAKTLASLARYWTVVDYYSGGDALGYHDQGVFLAPYFRSLDLGVFDWYQYMAEGSRNLALITGMVYALLPASLPGVFIFFAGLALCGAVFFYRAARLAAPDRDTTIYRAFVFFMPSVLFWPASLGKDAWVFFCSGFVLWGWALFVRRNQFPGLLLAAAALLAITAIRGHIAALLALAMAASFFLYVSRNLRRLPVLLVGGVILALVVVSAVSAGAALLRLDELTLEAIEDRYTRQQMLTSQGGSEITVATGFSPQGLAQGAVTVLLRPFLWEADNPQNLVAALETMVWLGIFWVRRKRLIANLASVRRDPLLGMCLFYSISIVFALTAIANLGIIARQRVMMLPFLWMLFL